MADDSSSDEENLECGVCLETNTLEGLTCCKGSICENCLDLIKMRDPNPTCPFCRQNIGKENYNREESEIKVVKANPAIHDWLERQAKATPGIQTREALQIRKYIMTMRPNVEEPPNFDYLFIGYYRTINDLWDDYDKSSEFKRLTEFTQSLDNYVPFYQVMPAKSNSTRLFPDRKIESTSYTSYSGRGAIVTKPSVKTGIKKKLPPPLPNVKKLVKPAPVKAEVEDDEEEEDVKPASPKLPKRPVKKPSVKPMSKVNRLPPKSKE